MNEQSAAWLIKTEQAMLQWGALLHDCLSPGFVLGLIGDLGVGKTTLIRGILRQAGEKGAVTSPTYTLVETYQLAQGVVHHFDLYRLEGAIDREGFGLRDYVDGEAICLIEWVDKLMGYQSLIDGCCHIEMSDEGRAVRVVGQKQWVDCVYEKCAS